MLTARGKKNENIAEYLLYMWQIEDLIRAFGLDIERIQQQLIDRYDQPEAVRGEIREWYESLIDMMRREAVVEKGHLQLNHNVILELDDLHRALLNAPKEQFYTMAYRKVLPLIVELRAKAGEEAYGEVETCLNALYGVLLLRLQKKEISPDTENAVALLSEFLRLLSAKYKQDKEEGLDLD
jgi:flagellin-specific chaperone FliS